MIPYLVTTEERSNNLSAFNLLRPNRQASEATERARLRPKEEGRWRRERKEEEEAGNETKEKEERKMEAEGSWKEGGGEERGRGRRGERKGRKRY